MKLIFAALYVTNDGPTRCYKTECIFFTFIFAVFLQYLMLFLLVAPV